MTDEQWDAILDVHLKAPFRILRAAQPVIAAAAKAERERGEPVRAARSSTSPRSPASAATPARPTTPPRKAGIVGLTKTLAKEWGRYNVNVNAVAFGFIKHPAHRGDRGRRTPRSTSTAARSRSASTPSCSR